MKFVEIDQIDHKEMADKIHYFFHVFETDAYERNLGKTRPDMVALNFQTFDKIVRSTIDQPYPLIQSNHRDGKLQMCGVPLIRTGDLNPWEIHLL